jgi:Flp pilus assembly secretin CpaC
MMNAMTFSRSFACKPALAAIAFIWLTGVQTAARAVDGEIIVDVDHARIVRVPEGAQTMVVGNPLIADVTMLKDNRLMVITGKSFGATNLIVLDQTGGQVGESIISVVQARGKVVVQRGSHRESYSCRPDCLPTIDLADDPSHLSATLGNSASYEGASNPRNKH